MKKRVYPTRLQKVVPPPITEEKTLSIPTVKPAVQEATLLFTNEAPTMPLPAVKSNLQKTDSTAITEMPTKRLPTVKPAVQEAIPPSITKAPTINLPTFESIFDKNQLLSIPSPKTQQQKYPSVPSFSQKMQATTQTMKAISRKVVAVWQKVPYRVEQLKVLSTRQERAYSVLVLVWAVVNLYFWIWWPLGGHIGNPVLFGLMSVALLYEGTLLPSFYTFYLGYMRHPKPIDVNLVEQTKVVQKVAVISLTVPGSESLEIVREQMIALTKIRYPHDCWILVDKEHSPTIAALARELGVFYFSRHDVATWGEDNVKRWNQPNPPFKAKTKAGNVNSWIDAYGHLYSHFTQLDIDHKPLPWYLHKVLGYFLDPKVKWVQAPSLYGNVEKWTARGSAEQEFVLQGPLQMGFYGFCSTPFIIGSHCTYDMEAIRAIGGFQPTRAEDHLDTVFLAARGYQGVFLPEVIAVGDGPENFETYLAQQFAWAYSMIQVLFNYTPKRIKYYTPRQALQFLFVQTWYIMWSLTMFTLFILPVISLFFNTPIAQVSYGEFMLHSLPVAVTAFMIWAWSHTWHLPKQLELSWRGVVLHIARWPIVMSALIQVILHVQKPYMITVKGLQHGKQRPFALKAHYPYLILIGLSLSACWFYLFTIGRSSVQGYLFFALQGAATLLLVYLTALVKDITDMMQEGISFASCILLRIKPLLLLIVIFGTFIWTACIAFAAIYTALLAP